MKPVQLSTGEWRILKGTPAVKAKKVVEKKVNKVMKNEREIAGYIKQFLSQSRREEENMSSLNVTKEQEYIVAKHSRMV